MKLIIDAHAHIFNARDIPMEGYLRSREPITLIEKIAELLKLRLVLIPMITSCIRKELHPETGSCVIPGFFCSLMRTCLFLFMRQYLKWVDTFCEDVVDIAKEMVDTFKKDNIDLYVPLMIDYEYWFKNTPDNPLKAQIDNIYKNVVLAYKGTVHPFVPFDPARELAFRKNMLNPDRKPELHGSLDLVKDAIENKGFIGVKLYNSMGYRPFNNATVDHKRRRRIGLHKEMGYHVFKGEEYDEVLCELYKYCVDNQVPITTHCGMYGIESYNNASFDFGQAVFWHEVLTQKEYQNLYLNLAHFGWNGKHRYHDKVSWVRDICEMLDSYEHLYVDVAHHDVVIGRKVSKYVADYKDICHDYPIVKKRLIFGIDWHVIKRVKNYENFKDDYIKVLQSTNHFTDEEINDFLGQNAVRFLGLQVGGKNRDRLTTFYKKHNIDPPQWFKIASNMPGS